MVGSPRTAGKGLSEPHLFTPGGRWRPSSPGSLRLGEEASGFGPGAVPGSQEASQTGHGASSHQHDTAWDGAVQRGPLLPLILLHGSRCAAQRQALAGHVLSEPGRRAEVSAHKPFCNCFCSCILAGRNSWAWGQLFADSFFGRHRRALSHTHTCFCSLQRERKAGGNREGLQAPGSTTERRPRH